MGGYLIQFSTIQWDSVYPGQRQKAYVEGTVKIRLVELSDEYGEDTWCEQEHIGFILDGRITIEFDDQSITFNKGDGMVIPSGFSHRHKGRIAKGEQVQMLFFERI